MVYFVYNFMTGVLKMKKIVASILTGVMLISSLSVSADNDFDYGYGRRNLIKEVEEYQPQDIGNLKGFSDIDNYDWAKSAIEDMSTGAYRGLFSGTTEPNEQGLARFSPADKMTRAEFITVVTRALYSDQLSNLPKESSGVWYTNYYNVALEKGLIQSFEIPFYRPKLESPIPREEMALILTRACKKMGEKTGELVDKDAIPDYNMVGAHYKAAVMEAYTKGLITGVDETGRFAPERTLTRAEGATVLYRLVNPSKRVDITDKESISEDLNAPIIIYEGQVRYNRNAKAGDTFIKKDGTSIILKLGPNGILGEGQGVAPDVGLLGQVTEKGCDIFRYKVADYGNWYDSTGMHLQNQKYFVNRTTGEGYWGSELTVLEKKYPAPDRDENPGSYEGQVSSDLYSLYVWKHGDWILNFNTGISW